jgi:hypothetical protein
MSALAAWAKCLKEDLKRLTIERKVREIGKSEEGDFIL